MAGPALLSSCSPPPSKDKHSKEVSVKNKPLSDGPGFSWALSLFTKTFLPPSPSATRHQLPHLSPTHLPLGPASASPTRCWAACQPSHAPRPAPTLPAPRDRPYRCSVRTSRTLSASQMFFAVTSPPDQRAREPRLKRALLSDSRDPAHLSTVPLGRPEPPPGTDGLRAGKTAFRSVRL